MKKGDLVKLHKPTEKNEENWIGIVVRYIPSRGDVNGEWEIHWLHHPPFETSWEYGYQLEVISERQK